MLHVIEHTLLESIKMLPFLFVSYLIIEFIEHRNSDKIKNMLANSGKFGSVIGALLGCFPQCGFSVTASNLYAGRIITLGTLISVFIATSDEAIPVLLSNPGSAGHIFKILFAKVIIAILVGTIIDLVIKSHNKKKNHVLENEEKSHDMEEHIHQMCSHCDCEHGMLKSTLKHTASTFVFILIVAFVLNAAIYFIGEENLKVVLLNGSILQPVVAALIGMIPNCASSVILTELYLAGSISFASIIAGLSTGAGLGIAVLFKVNKNMKENLKILALTYSIGAVAGIIIEILTYIF